MPKDINKSVVSLLDVNRLLYVPSTDASPVITRSQRKQFPQKNSYVADDVMVFELHGSYFIDMCQSNLSFDLVGSSNLDFGKGSVLNLFKEVRIIASNGKVISRIQKANLLNFNLMYAKHGSAYRVNMADAISFQPTLALTTSKHFSVPLKIISPFFATPQLLPPRIMEGLRIEVTLERPEVALKNVSSYTLSSPIFTLDSYELNNQVNIILAEMSPLIYEFKSWKHTASMTNSSQSSNTVVNKHSLANALEAMLIPRNYAETVQSAAESFSSNFVLAEDDHYQFRWGSVLLPQTEIIKPQEWYNQMLYVNDQLKSDTMTNFNISYSSYINTIGFSTAVAQLRRSNVLDKSGLELSNQNELECSYKISASGNRIADMFIQHLARVVLDGDLIRVEE